MKKILLCFIIAFAFASCRANLQSNLSLTPKIQLNPRANETAEKIKALNESISTHKINRTIFYYSNGETFQNFDGFTFYLTPYLVEDSSIVQKVSMRLFAKSVTNRKNMFRTVTVFDEQENEVTFHFKKIIRTVENDDFLITETSDLLVDYSQIQILDKMIDSKNIYVTFSNEKSYTFKMNVNLRESFLNIVRKYKLMINRSVISV